MLRRRFRNPRTENTASVAFLPRPVCALSLAALLAVSFSCSDDDDGGPPPGPPNNPPEARAGDNQTVNAGATVTLDGSRSSDPDGDPLTYAWTQTSGTAVTLSDAAVAQPTFTAPAGPASLRFSLTIQDGRGGTASDEVLVTVQGAQNAPPTANAGADRTVATGAAAMLFGTGSDPEGGAVTYAWTQTGGTMVTLSSTSDPLPSFTAPGAAGTLTFMLTVTDPQSAMAMDTVTITVGTPPAVVPTLWVTNSDSVSGFENPATLNGNQAPQLRIAGANTGITGGVEPLDVVVDGRGAAHALLTNQTISIFDAGNQSGNVMPNRILQGPETLLSSPKRLSIAPNRDVLFVADNRIDVTLVWDGPSDAGFSGAVAPNRFLDPGFSSFLAIDLARASDDQLYVLLDRVGSILVFPNASSGFGTSWNRAISYADPGFWFATGLFVDGNDRLYVSNANLGTIYVFDNVSSLSGIVTPDRTITLSGFPEDVAVDSANRGYASDRNNNRIYSFDNIHQANGAVTPDRTIEGANTLLMKPRRLFIVE